MAKLSNLAHRDIETVIHPYTNLAAHREVGPLVLEEARGIHIYDNEGKEYIEGLAGLWCTSLGYGNEELVEAAASQMSRLSYTHLFGHKSNDMAIELSEKLKEIAPCETSKILFCGSGSEANGHADQTDLVLQQCPWQAGKKENHFTHQRLSRRDHCLWFSDRSAAGTC